MKTSLIIFIGVIVIVMIPISMFLMNPDYEKLNPVHRYFATSIVDKLVEFESSIDKEQRTVIEYDTVLSILSFYENALMARIFEIKPTELGFKGKFYSLDKPADLIKIPSVILTKSKPEVETGVQYYPRHAFRDYEEMMDSMQVSLGRRLYMDSGYRSPGRQAFLFFYYLVKTSDFVLKENARWIAMPGYSEHGSPLYTAIDFISEEGINGFSGKQIPEDFEKLQEYEWLRKNAGLFNFYLSYPRDNDLGVAFEPWHWHWEGDASIYSDTNAAQFTPND